EPGSAHKKQAAAEEDDQHQEDPLHVLAQFGEKHCKNDPLWLPREAPLGLPSPRPPAGARGSKNAASVREEAASHAGHGNCTSAFGSMSNEAAFGHRSGPEARQA